jgi:hypothetical protein
LKVVLFCSHSLKTDHWIESFDGFIIFFARLYITCLQDIELLLKNALWLDVTTDIFFLFPTNCVDKKVKLVN